MVLSLAKVGNLCFTIGLMELPSSRSPTTNVSLQPVLGVIYYPTAKLMTSKVVGIAQNFKLFFLCIGIRLHLPPLYSVIGEK